MSNKGLNFVGLLFNIDGKLKICDCLKDELSLTKSEELMLFQMILALPKQWREIVATYDDNLNDAFLPKHNLI